MFDSDFSLQVEKARHVLLLREKLQEQNKTHELSKLDKEASNMLAKANSLKEVKEESGNDADEEEDCKMAMTESSYSLDGGVEYDRDRELASKCLKLMMQGRIPLTPMFPKVRVPHTPHTHVPKGKGAVYPSHSSYQR